MRSTLQPGLDARLEYLVPPERTVPHLLPESEEGLASAPLTDISAPASKPSECTSISVMRRPHHPIALSLVEVEVTAVDRRQVTFTVHAFDEAATVCRGTHKRTVIDTVRFQDRLRQRAATISGDPA